MPNSQRSSKGFQQIPDDSRAATMVNPNDATIDIPLTGVTSKTGARVTTQPSPDQNGFSEKQANGKNGFYQRHVAGRRKSKLNGKKGHAEEEDALGYMGRVYNKILNFSIVTRYFLYILPLAILISIPIILGATACQNATIGGVRIVWFFSWVLIVWTSLWVSKLVSKCLPAVFQFLCGIVSSGTRKYALVLTSLEIYLSLTGWSLTSLATFIPVMTNNPTQRAQQASYNKYNDPGANATATEQAGVITFKTATSPTSWELLVQRVLAAFLVASLILLAEKLLIQLISISYHRTQFNAKIKDSKHKIHLLSLLYEASRQQFPAYCNEFAEEDYIINDAIEISEAKLGHHSKSSGTETPMRLLQNVGRMGDKLTSAFGNIAHEVTGKEVFNPNSAHSIVIEALEKNRSSEALAKRLWMSFVVEGKEALYEQDLIEVLGPDLRDSAEEAFAVLDRDGNGDISLDEMILTVCEFGKERHSIANSLHDVDQAINVLDGLLCTIVFIVVIFVFVAFLNSSFTTTLATAGTALLSMSFVFATTAQEVLGSCIFLFVKHPFDVLDRVDIADDQLVVKHISLLFTVFKHVDTHKLTQVPNITLNSLWIQNVSRSEAMREQLKINVSFDTSLEDVQLLRNEMQAFVSDKDNSRDFQPEIDVELTGLASMDKLELKVEIRHKSNWSNETIRAARRSKFMCALVLALRKIPINAPGGGGAALGSLDQPTYSVNVSDVQAAANRDAFKEGKEAKRLFPSKKAADAPTKDNKGFSSALDTQNPHNSATPEPLRLRSPPSESTALTALNTRHPAADTAQDPKDYADPATPKSLARTSGTFTPTDMDRATSIEEVRGMLRRQSTRGKRKAANAPANNQYPNIAENRSLSPLPLPPSKAFEYDPYSYGSQGAPRESLAPPPGAAYQSPNSQISTSGFPTPQPANFPVPPSKPQQSQTPAPPPPVTEQQQRPPTSAGNYPPRQPLPTIPSSDGNLPALPPKDKAVYHEYESEISSPSSATTSQRSVAPFASASQTRSASPVRNPFQINALRAQAQGVGVPRVQNGVPGSTNSNGNVPIVRPDSFAQVQGAAGVGNVGGGGAATPPTRRPVPGSGNSFAGPQAASGVVTRPARSDSLSARSVLREEKE